MNTGRIIWCAIVIALIGILPSCAAPNGGALGMRRGSNCEVFSLSAVFANPTSYSGKTFCGDAVGVPQRTGITFFPVDYERASRFYDVAMFLDDRRLNDRLRLSQTGPFRIHVEGTIRPAEECFSEEAAAGDILCTPTRRPITLRVARVGEPVRILP
jgi:hypothetical protein